MCRGSKLPVLTGIAALVFYREAITAAPPPLDVQNVEEVRAVFHAHDYDERMEKRRQYLVRMGEKAFPAYEAILVDPKAQHNEVSGLFVILRDVKADRRRFRRHAISRLTDSNKGVRRCAVTLLGHIGGSTEASSIVALLSDEDRSIAYASAKALSAIGGPNEVVAMDVWLRGVSHRDDRQLREHVQKCRDELKKRLDAKNPPKK